jgi:hypothetical protein
VIAWAFLAADSIDVLSGAAKSYLAMFGDLIPKDKVMILLTTFPGAALAGCFLDVESPNTEWLDALESTVVWTAIDQAELPPLRPR